MSILPVIIKCPYCGSNVSSWWVSQNKECPMCNRRL